MTEDCYRRATVALTRTIQHTYIVSPLDMAGMMGMAQTLAVYHYGYNTLKAGQIQFHGSALVPSETAAVLDWGLDIPLTSLDKPLAITMIVTVNGGSLRRYRLVIAQKSKLRLTPEVLAHLHPKVETTASQPADSSPVPSMGSTYMDMLRMDTARHSGCALPTTETRF